MVSKSTCLSSQHFNRFSKGFHPLCANPSESKWCRVNCGIQVRTELIFEIQRTSMRKTINLLLANRSWQFNLGLYFVKRAIEG